MVRIKATYDAIYIHVYIYNIYTHTTPHLRHQLRTLITLTHMYNTKDMHPYVIYGGREGHALAAAAIIFNACSRVIFPSPNVLGSCMGRVPNLQPIYSVIADPADYEPILSSYIHVILFGLSGRGLYKKVGGIHNLS